MVTLGKEVLMAGQAQSIQYGSARLGSFAISGFQVTSVTFPPSLTLSSHYHERACFALVLEGAVEKLFARASHISTAGSVVTMPPEERHTDHFKAAGAHMMVIEPDMNGRGGADNNLEALLHPCLPVLGQINHYRESDIVNLGWRVYRELQDPDPVSSLAISGLVLEMLACAARNHSKPLVESRPPAWLDRAREYLHAHFNCSFQIADVAEAVGVHPVHLARAFRQYYGASPSGYLRRLRLNWVAAQLARSDKPLSYLAEHAGFSDQSHLTRLFKRQTGVTPGQYRREVHAGR
jgi:AraC family transcriptional regulator